MPPGEVEALQMGAANRRGLLPSPQDGVTIYVVSHGATKMNNQTDLSEDRIRGWSNVPLSDEGRQDAHKAAEELKPLGIQVIVTSDLARAVETAQIIGQIIGVQPTPNHKLRPWNLGDFTGANTKEALPKIAVYAQETPDQPIPGGESFNSFKERLFQGLAEVIQLAAGRPVAIVTHHRDERVMRAWEAMGEPPTHEIDLGTFLQKGDPPGGVFEMQINPAALAPAGGAPQPGMPPGGPAQPGGVQLPVPVGGQPPVPGQPPGGAPPQQNPMFAKMMAFQQKIQQISKAIDLLRQDAPRGYRIDIEVDTMVAGDHQEERQDATEFLKAVTQFIQEAGQIAMVQPDFAPLAAKMLQFGVRKFRTGRDLESAIDEYADKVAKNPPKPQPAAGQKGAGPHDAAIAQAKVQSEQARSKAEITKAQMEAKSAEANDQREQQLKVLEFQMKTKEFQMRMAEMDREEQFKLAEHQRKTVEHGLKIRAVEHSARREQEAQDAVHKNRLREIQTPTPMPNGGAAQ